MELGYLAIFTALAAIIMVNMFADRSKAKHDARERAYLNPKESGICDCDCDLMCDHLTYIGQNCDCDENDCAKYERNTVKNENQ